MSVIELTLSRRQKEEGPFPRPNIERLRSLPPSSHLWQSIEPIQVEPKRGPPPITDLFIGSIVLSV